MDSLLRDLEGDSSFCPALLTQRQQPASSGYEAELFQFSTDLHVALYAERYDLRYLGSNGTRRELLYVSSYLLYPLAPSAAFQKHEDVISPHPGLSAALLPRNGESFLSVTLEI